MVRNFIDKKIVIASNNEGKVSEIKDILKNFNLRILTNKFFKIGEPIENGVSFKENALIKALNTAKKTKLVAISDDSGICFSALNGEPGIYSARYAGQNKDFKVAMTKLNKLMKYEKDKTCKFVCALSLCWPDGYNITVEGEVHGIFVWPPRGNKGFGYDPIFYYPKSQKTFGELNPTDKHAISHRNLAFKKLNKIILKFINV